jgi:outer membrane lipoprotein-sorting protein
MGKVAMLLCALLLAVFSVTGCQSMGKATGEAIEEIEEGAEQFEKGYHEGKGS